MIPINAADYLKKMDDAKFEQYFDVIGESQTSRIR
jgi:hypothetical protein